MNPLTKSSVLAASLVFTVLPHTYAYQVTDNLEVSGWLRANIQDKSYSQDEHQLKFNAAKLMLKYQNDPIGFNLEYRCYQFDQLCDFAALVDANMSYSFDAQHKLTLGLQDVPFGPGRAWSSNWYGGILVNTGLEDVHNLGINYQYPINKDTQIELAYFLKDGGDYHGKIKDAARYSANFVRPDPESEYSHLEERNLWLIRLQYNMNLNDHLNLNLGGSYWYSDIDNKTMSEHGSTQRWAAFSKLSYEALVVTATVGHTQTDNKDPLSPDISIMGSFDSIYPIANDGYFYTVDLSYHLKLNEKSSFTPYLTYSHFDKDKTSFIDSTRYTIGAQWDLYPISVAAEYIYGKSDHFIGGTQQGFAAGDHHKESLTNLLFLYHF